MDGDTHRFGDFELDTALHQLRQNGEALHVEPRAFDLLRYLIEHQDRVVSKNELLDNLWGDRFVSEAALTTALRTARIAIGDNGTAQRLIQTVHGKGYRFIATSQSIPSTGLRRRPAGTSPMPSGSQDIRFCRAEDGTRIAYATVGDGQPLLKAANWMSHLDLEWSTPVWSHWLRGLATNRQLIRYDERGCGLSDWKVPSFTFDDWVTDLETVVDALQLERFPLLGVSQGGAVAIAYAVRHPERVSKLILAGAYAQGRQVRAETEVEKKEAELDLELARVGLMRHDPSFLQVFAAQFLPTGTPEEWEDFIEFQRQSTSPDNAVRFLEAFGTIDVSDIAPRVECPTLVLHSRDDVRVPATQAKELTALIPNSRLVLLDSRNHLLTESEPAWPEFLAQIEDFLTD